MRLRGVLLGLAGAVFIAAFGYYNDAIMQLTPLVGNHFPFSVFGLLFLFLLGVNPLLYRLHATWRFGKADLALATGLMLVACSLPGTGFMRGFQIKLTSTVYWSHQRPGWQKNNLLGYIDPALLPADGEYDERVIRGPRTGLRLGGGHRQESIGLWRVVRDEQGKIVRDAVPWRAWAKPLQSWMSMYVVMTVGVFAIGLILHRQWSKREHLRYPIADVVGRIYQQDGRHAFAHVFRQKPFWLAFGIVFFIHLVNGISAWKGGFITIPLQFDLTALMETFPRMTQTGMWWTHVGPKIFPTVVAIAFFLASDVSFSLGISHLVYTVLAVNLLVIGVDLSGSGESGSFFSWQKFGAFLGMGGMILYLGRHYYWNLAKRAFFFRSADGVRSDECWAARVALVAMVSLVVMMAHFGLDWTIGLLVVALLYLMFVVLSRIIAETGLFFITTPWTILAVLLGLFGVSALGPKALITAGLMAMILTGDVREVLMPFFVNVLKINDDAGQSPGRVTVLSGAVWSVALSVALVAVMWMVYNYGLRGSGYGWGFNEPAFMTQGNLAVNELQHLGALQTSKAYSPLERLAHFSPDPDFLWAAGLGLVLVLVVSFCRLRFFWWPLHPVLFLTWNSYATATFAHSFLIGWMIRTVVLRIWGAKSYERVKVFMIGVIAGEFIALLLIGGWSVLEYFLIGQVTGKYRFFP